MLEGVLRKSRGIFPVTFCPQINVFSAINLHILALFLFSNIFLTFLLAVSLGVRLFIVHSSEECKLPRYQPSQGYPIANKTLARCRTRTCGICLTARRCLILYAHHRHCISNHYLPSNVIWAWAAADVSMKPVHLMTFMQKYALGVKYKIGLLRFFLVFEEAPLSFFVAIAFTNSFSSFSFLHIPCFSFLFLSNL